jgi:hypothetical protein
MEEKLRYAKRLIEEGAAPAGVIKFALFDSERLHLKTHGANRNATLLDTVGDVILSVDDDTVCRVAPSPLLDNEAKFVTEQRFSVSEIWDMWVFLKRKEVMDFCDFADKDPLGIHEQVLGQTANGFQSDAARVLVTFNGVAGDSGWGSPLPYLLMTGDSLKRLTQSLNVYQSSCLSREILRVARRVTVSARTFEAPAHAFGIDNRDLLPPYFPVGGAEELIYWATLSKCRRGYVAQLPWSLLHAPVEDRAYASGEIVKGTSGVMISSVMRAVIGSFERGDGGEKIQQMGEYLVSVASQPGKDFQRMVYDELRREGHSLISHLEQRLEAANDSPTFWANDIKRCINNLRQSISRLEAAIPLNLLNGRSMDEAREMAQRLVLKFGQLLRWWPDMIEAARKLKREEYSLARPV